LPETGSAAFLFAASSELILGHSKSEIWQLGRLTCLGGVRWSGESSQLQVISVQSMIVAPIQVFAAFFANRTRDSAVKPGPSAPKDSMNQG
jgi:hypothetical protein